MKNRGFTLIELVVSMAIIAILAAAGLSAFSSSQIKGKDGRRKSDLNQLSKALELYYNDYRQYPAASSGKIVGCGGSGATACDWGSGPFRDSKGTIYMQTLPKDPFSSSRKYYYYSNATSYALYSWLENNNDTAIITPAVSGTDCGTASGNQTCSYGISSPNIKP